MVMLGKTYFETLRELYFNSINSYADNPCFSIYEDESTTYRTFADRVDRMSAIFSDAGLEKGDKIALFCNNMPNWNACYFAAVINGYVIVPMLPDFSADDATTIIAHSEAKVLMVSDKLFGKIRPEVIDKLKMVVRARDMRVIRTKSCTPIPVKDAVTIDPDDVAAIIYTSGTTSSPKGVMLTHRNLCSQLNMVYQLQTIEPKDVMLSVLPLSHTYECTLGMLLPFMCGASVVYIDKLPTANVLMPIFKVVRPTMMLTVPLIMEKIYKNKILPQFTSNFFIKMLYSIPFIRKVLNRIAGKKLYETFGGRIHFFGIGGAKVDPRVEKFLLEAKFPYAIGYGLTETSPLLAGANPSMVRLESTGKMLNGIQVRIDNMNPQTGEGEIVVKGENVMKGYYKNPEITAEVLKDGWFYTKDLGVLDADGFLYIKGRSSNMILGASGENIYPEEIEHVINEHVYVEESLVKQDDNKRLVALVKFNRDELSKKYNLVKAELEIKIETLKKELLNYVNERVNKFSKISSVHEEHESFQKTATNKIKRFLYK